MIYGFLIFSKQIAIAISKWIFLNSYNIHKKKKKKNPFELF